MNVHACSVAQSFVTPWTAACQTPLSMGFPRQEYWSGLPFLSPGDLPDPGVKPGSLALQADSLLSEPPRKPQSVPNAILNTLLTLIPLIPTPDLRMKYSY